MLRVEGAMAKPPCFDREELRVLAALSFRKLESPKSIWTPGIPKKVCLEQSLSFKNWEPIDQLEAKTPVENKKIDLSMDCSKNPELSCLYEHISPKPKSELDAAAVKLQKVYKSYRTRRNLADCAVVTEELWWKTLDSASLKQSSILFFHVDKRETAISRWARAKKRVAKVGKGLSKDEKAQKLALQHWLEAIDPRHRYGHNLHLYYDVWFRSESTEPFFYWLDVGAGKEINLDKCPRNKLHQQCIKYLGQNEREAYEVVVNGGKLVFKQSEQLVHTEDGSKWIFVLSTSRNLYVGKKQKGTFQHSSFLSGAATTAAGRLVAKAGVLKAIWPYSGHYLPTEENFKEFISFLLDNNVDLTDVKRCSVDDDDFPSFRKKDVLRIDPPEVVEVSVTNVLPTGTASVCSNDVRDVDDAASSTVKVRTPVSEFTKRLSSKWTSGIGARISCVRDYPADIQAKALEQVNLSPRVSRSPRSNRLPIPSPRPGDKIMVSPRLACIGFPSPQLPSPKPPTPNRSTAPPQQFCF